MTWIAIGLLTVAVLGLSVLAYQLLTQQGRLLLRIEALERAAPHAVGSGSAALDGNHARTAPVGLPVGTAFPSFSATDIDGRPVALPDFRGRPLLLVHWSQTCGFCDMIAPDLAALNKKLPIVRLEGRDLEPFAQMGTPAAYLIDQRGNVARPMALGADSVLALAREAAGSPRKRLPGERPLSESLVLRDGLKPGTPAPSFRLADLDGRTVSLDQYRGRRVLLVFSDPQCGPCDQLAPQLVELAREHEGSGLALVMVGRGDREENRKKARANGLTFPVVVQDRWKLSKEYGIFATPVAFLIDEDGRVARPVAKGLEEILALGKLADQPAREMAHGHVV